MEVEGGPDLSAFPLLRLDELPIIDLATLERSLCELQALASQGGDRYGSPDWLLVI